MHLRIFDQKDLTEDFSFFWTVFPLAKPYITETYIHIWCDFVQGPVDNDVYANNLKSVGK